MKIPSLHLRFSSIEHYNQVAQAAADAGLSLNAWIVRATQRALDAEKSR